MMSLITKFVSLLAVLSMASATTTTPGEEPPSKYGLIVYPGFQALDVFGPMDVFNMLSLDYNISLSILSSTLDPVSTTYKNASTYNPFSAFEQRVVPTHTFDNAPKDLEVILVPGGIGTRTLENTAPAREFLTKYFPKLRYLITVCTGSGLVAKTGILDGKRATSNKFAWSWATSEGPKVKWVAHARWVTDGNIWTSSGVAAGIDVTHAFVSAMYGNDVSQLIADKQEHVRNTDPNNDPFQERWNVTQPVWPEES